MRNGSQRKSIFINILRLRNQVLHKIAAAHVVNQVAEELAAERIVPHILEDAASIGIGVGLFEIVGSTLRKAFEELTEIESRLPQTADALDPQLVEDWERCNRAFHAALVSASGSPMLNRLRDQLYRQSERYRRVSLNQSRRWRNVHDEHAAIFDATMQRNALKAARMIELHMSRTAEEVRRAIEQLASRGPR